MGCVAALSTEKPQPLQRQSSFRLSGPRRLPALGTWALAPHGAPQLLNSLLQVGLRRRVDPKAWRAWRCSTSSTA